MDNTTSVKYRLVENAGKFELNVSMGESTGWRVVTCGHRERICSSACAWFSIRDNKVYCKDYMIADLSVCEACGGTGYIKIPCACTDQPVRPSEERRTIDGDDEK